MNSCNINLYNTHILFIVLSMKRKILISCSIAACFLWWLVVYGSFTDDVFPWLQEYGLTKYTNENNFRPNDSITRWETAKFVTEYANSIGLETVWWRCTFSDIATYDSTLQSYIPQACNLGLLKWSKGKFMPSETITEAQAITMVVRSIYGYQDETTSPRYLTYYQIGEEIGLVSNEDINSINTTPITRRKLAEWLHLAFNSTEDEVAQDENWYIYETDVDSANDCTSYESYDSTNKVCYYTCETQQQCSDINAQIEDELASWTDSLEADDRNFDEQWWDQSAEQTSKVIYTISAGEKATKKQGTDLPEYKQIWEEVAELAPNTLSDTYLETFEVFDDSNSDIAAFVADEDGNGKRHMAVNLAIHKNSDIKEQKATLIHELSHIITLNNNQFMKPSSQCPQYETDEWCTKASSYLNQFYQKFWKGLSNPAYSSSNFVTEYATTSTEEDIAESFAFFVLESNHSNNNTRNQKVHFFNTFPELVTMRQEMRSVLTKYAIRLKKSTQ